ncbi:serpin family protein [Stackebrandtia endophytica]|nr:serpin family protein [Stackebrandtia endophytica]
METPRSAAAEHVNRLTVSWLRDVTDPPQVLSGVGLWPLLAALRLGTEPGTDDELAAATGTAHDELAAELAALVTLLNDSRTMRIALGIWSGQRIRLDPAWLAQVPVGLAGQLTGDAATDQAMLDSWASTNTAGLIPTFPLTVDSDVDVVLASALALRTRWREPFMDEPWHFNSGPWSGERTWHGLTCVTEDMANLRVWDDGSTTLTIPGEADVDVVLVMGDVDTEPTEVLARAVENLSEGGGYRTGTDLTVGEEANGVTVTRERDADPDPVPRLEVTTVAFDVGADHDILDSAGVLGLLRSLDPATSSLTGLTVEPVEPVVVTQARQRAVARFSAVGFEAAAVTAMAWMAGAMLPSPEDGWRTVVRVTFNRPFGYLVVHRPTGVMPVVGWVDTPARWPEE